MATQAELEQRIADFSQRRVQVLLGELALAAQVLEGSLEFLCECLKHDRIAQRAPWPPGN